MTKHLRLSTFALALIISAPAGAQTSTRPQADSTAEEPRKGGANWFVSLMRRIARRSDDEAAAAASVTADSTSAADSAAAEVVATSAATTVRSFKSRKDSLAWEGARTTATRSSGYRIVVDLFARRLSVIDGADTLRSAPAATAMNATLSYGGKTWRFETPRGVRTVLRKDRDPKWTPPEWHFAEIALEHKLKLKQLERGRTVRLSSGNRLVTQGDMVGIIRAGSTEFEPMILDEHIVFDNTLFIAPAGTKHRQIEGELGRFRLDMGNGYLLHGTPYTRSIGSAVTHGCVRLGDEDIEWLFENVPVGTKVYIY